MVEGKPTTDNFSQFMYFNPDGLITKPDDWSSSAVLDEKAWAALRSGWNQDDTLLEWSAITRKCHKKTYYSE